MPGGAVKAPQVIALAIIRALGVEGGAVKIGDDKVSDPAQKVAQPAGELVIQAGKRTFVKVK
mgnify:CR=1 FL=1